MPFDITTAKPVENKFQRPVGPSRAEIQGIETAGQVEAAGGKKKSRSSSGSSNKFT